MFKNKDFASSLDTNTFYFNHFNFNNFTPYNGRHIPSEGLPLDMIHEKTSLFEGSGIGNSKAVLQVTRRMIIARYFMLLFDLTPDRAASEGHISLHTRAISNWNFGLTSHFPKLSRVFCISNMINVCV